MAISSKILPGTPFFQFPSGTDFTEIKYNNKKQYFFFFFILSKIEQYSILDRTPPVHSTITQLQINRLEVSQADVLAFRLITYPNVFIFTPN